MLFASSACAVPVVNRFANCEAPIAVAGAVSARPSLTLDVSRPSDTAPTGPNGGDGLNPESPAADQRVFATDAEGHALPGMPTGTTDGRGRAQLGPLPPDTAFVVTAPVTLSSGAVIRLKTMVKTGSAGTPSVALNLATTLVTEAVLSGRRGQLVDLDASAFAEAVSRMSVRLATHRAPDLADLGALLAWLDQATREDAALSGAIDALRVRATRPRPVARASASPAASPTPTSGPVEPAPTNSPEAAPTPAAPAGGAGFAARVTTVSTRLSLPYSLARDPQGHVLVAHRDGVSRLGHDGVVTPLGAAGTTANACYGVAADPAGNVYVSDSVTRLIRRISPLGISTTIATAASAGSAGGVGLPGTFQPWGLVVDRDRHVVFADYGNHCIRRVSPEGAVTTVAGTGQPGHLDGPAGQAQFSFPMNLAVDAAGHLYVTDSQSGHVRRIAPDGTVSTLTQLLTPAGITVGPGGVLYMTSFGSHLVQRLTPDGTLSVVAGSGEFGWRGGGMRDDVGLAAMFASPFGLVADGDVLYVADTWNNRIRRIE
jgi:sugar lactone lactonase YvrE